MVENKNVPLIRNEKIEFGGGGGGGFNGSKFGTVLSLTTISLNF
jgi:hypothetical protein